MSSTSDDLGLFSYEVLGLVGRSGAGAHDLLRMSRRGRMLDWAGESQYYAEPKRLARLGYLAARREPGRTRERTVYTLTDKGLDALRDWARTPARFTPVKSEPLVRLLIADLVGPEATREGLAGLRDELVELRELIADREASAESLPHRRENLLVTLSFLRGLLDLYETWLVDVERALDAAELAGATPYDP